MESLFQIKGINLWWISMYYIWGVVQWFLAPSGYVPWEKSFGTSKLLTMKFSYLDKRVFLQGLHPSGSTLLDADKFFSSSAKKDLVLQIEVVNNPGLEQSPLPTALSELLDQFS